MANTRNTKPEKGNKYYIRTASGGYSTCIQGSPKDSVSDVLANCVGFANGFWNEGEGQNKQLVPLNCNAENFIERAIAYGLSVYKEPMVGGIMVWQKGATLSGSDGAGHVAGVYAKPSNDQIKTAESGYGSSTPFWTATRNRGNGNWGAGTGYTYRGCIAPKGYKPTDPTPTPTPTTYKFNIGDKVVLNGQLYGNSAGGNPGQIISGKVTTITRRADGAKCPYNTTGDLGWMAESSITKYVEPTPTPTPTPEPTPTPAPQPAAIAIGDKVVFKSKANWGIYTSYDSNNRLKPMYDGGVVTAIYSKSVYPKAKNEYQLNKVRGYVRAEDIKKA